MTERRQQGDPGDGLENTEGDNQFLMEQLGYLIQRIQFLEEIFSKHFPFMEEEITELHNKFSELSNACVTEQKLRISSLQFLKDKEQEDNGG